MSKSDLYIIAAGKGSRMGGSLPKALVPIANGEPNITTTLRQASGKFNNIYVVINEHEEIQNQWLSYFAGVRTDTKLVKNVYPIAIMSGLGDGHAILSAFSAVSNHKFYDNQPANDVVICWGDAFIQHEETFNEILAKNLQSLSPSGLIPAVKEQNPYVTLLVDSVLKCKSADFSKFGECHPSGWHDQSVFRFNKEQLTGALDALSCSLWKNGRYMTPGNELSLLYAFHYLYNIGKAAIVYETDYPVLSFNTPDEVYSIQEEISKKWKKTNQF